MAIEKMKMVSIIGKYEMLDDTIQAYLDSGCFQPEQAAQFVENIKGFANLNEENPFATWLNQLTEILQSANINPEPVADAGPTPSKEIIEQKMQKIDERLGSLQKQKAKLGENIATIKDTIEKLSHFEELDIDLGDVAKSQFIKFRFGRLPTDSYDKLKYYKSNPYVLFFPCSTEGDYLWGAYVAPVESATEVDSIFSSLFFERLHLPDSVGTPAEARAALEEQLKTAQHQYDELSEIIGEFNHLNMDEYLQLYTQLKRSYDAFEIRKYATKYGDSFMLVGWIPEKDIDTFKKYIDRVDAIEYSFENPEDEKNVQPPIKLKNPKVFKPFEYYVEMFGVPDYDEIDPTPFMAITYTLLYGIMFADVGQGLILALAGFLMYKLKGMQIGRILIPCGIAGSFFGLIFGSVFGFENLLDPMYRALGFSEKPIEIMSSINEILILAVAIGVVMMILAIGLNIFCCLKRKQLGEALVSENGLSGLIVYISIIGLILSIFLDALAPFSLVFVLGIVIPAILLMFKEPIAWRLDGKGKFKREQGLGEYMMQSFFELFEALLSYITNTVSFLRVGAFVLVHFGMMMEFFTLADMTSNPVIYYLIIILGNVLVLVLEGLLVGVQSLRLEFYEMFSRFYSGDGKPYTPAKIGEYKNH